MAKHLSLAMGLYTQKLQTIDSDRCQTWDRILTKWSYFRPNKDSRFHLPPRALFDKILTTFSLRNALYFIGTGKD